MNCDVLSSLKVIWKVDGECLVTGEPETLGGVAVVVLQWNDSHTDEVTAMNPLKALGKHRSHSLVQDNKQATSS